VELLEDRLLLSATLVSDINQTTADAFPLIGPPAQAAILNGVAYFTADDGTHFNALWKSDGTAGGTRLVTDLGGGSITGNLTASNGELYFSAGDPVHGNEPWVSDGTAAGTHLLLDINPGSSLPVGFPPLPGGRGVPNSSDPSQFTTVGKLTFFTASDGVHGQELWVTDGKAADTHMVLDINPNNSGPFFNGESPSELTAYKGRLYFMADDGVHGVELWTSDGSTAGTHLVKDVNPGSASSAPAYYPVPFITNPPQMVVSGGILYFVADDGVHGNELWASDGRAASTHLVRDINPGSTSSPIVNPPPGLPTTSVLVNSSNPSWLTDVNGKLYFTANDGVHGVELWTSDGTAAGTHLAADVLPGSDAVGNHYSSDPQNLTVSGGKLFFLAANPRGGQSLWVLNPASNAVTRLEDLAVPPNPLYLPGLFSPGASAPLLAAGNKIYFVNYDASHGRELWASDGTVQGTRLVKDVRPGAASSQIGFLAALNGKALFAANDGTHGRELWVSAGSASDTHLVKDINRHTNSATPQELTRIGNIVYFTADDGIHGSQLWRTDGTAAGTRMVKDINPGVVPNLFAPGETDPAGANIRELVSIDKLLYFVADDGVHGSELWRSDGTAAGTWMVKDVNPGSASSNISDLTVMGHRLFFAADDGVHGSELWVSDGTAAGTHLLKDVNAQPLPTGPIFLPGYPPPLVPLPPGPGSAGATQRSSPSDLTVLNGNLYFVADDGVHGRQLWMTEGNSVDTHMVVDLPAGAGSNPSQLTRVGHVIYFTASDGIHGQALWRTNGTAKGTVVVSAFNPGTPPPIWPVPISAFPTNLTAAGNTLYFTADDGTHGISLYKADAAGVSLLKSLHLVGTPYFSLPPNLTIVGRTLFFTVDDGIHGNELWKSDGSRSGTMLVKDIFPGRGPFGPNGSGPASLTAVNGRLYFTADDGVHGREVWSSDGTAKGTVMVRDVNPGPASGADWTLEVVGLGKSVLFTASDGTHGVELWRL
jgi:ELWxxDGT repeat protein